MMQTLVFSIPIQASPEQVWFALWDDTCYREWTSVFQDGSYYNTLWKQGGRIQFLGPDGSGMYSEITLCKPFEKMHFTHIGEMKQFREIPTGDTPPAWSGGREQYSLSEQNGITTLSVTLDMVEDTTFINSFKEAFPKGLAIVKESAEHLYITVKTMIKASIEAVWHSWTNPDDIMQWNSASEDWHTTRAENDLRIGGSFSSTMAAKDNSMSFDFKGTYTHVEPNKSIMYRMEDGRAVTVLFREEDGIVHITESFQPENEHSLEMQQSGWQSILDHFKQFVSTKNPS